MRIVWVVVWLVWGVLGWSGCVSHRASMPPGNATLPVFAEPENLYIAVGGTPFASQTPSAGVHVGGRFSEHVAFGLVAETNVGGETDPILPGMVFAPQMRFFVGPAHLDLSGGITQSSLFVAGRLGLAHELRWDDGRWGLRGSVSVFGAVPVATSCGGFVACTKNGRTQAAYGADTTLGFGVRLGEVELVMAPMLGVVRPGGDPATVYYGLAIQLEGTLSIGRAAGTEPSP